MNVAAIHAKMEQHVPIMSIDFTVAVHQGTMECVVKMVRFLLCRLNYLLTVTQIKVDVKCDMVVICSFILLVKCSIPRGSHGILRYCIVVQ